MRKITKFKKSIRAVSPVISALLMITIAVVASIVAYAYVTGYIGGQTDKAGNSVQLQSYSSQSNLVIYVQNTGQGLVHLKQDSSVYVNDNLKNIVRLDGNDVSSGELIPVNVGQTVELTIGYIPQPNEQLKIKIVTVEGTFMEASATAGNAISTTKYTVSYYPSTGGSIDPAGTISNYKLGSVQPISAHADSGYAFSSWTFAGALQINNPTSPSTTVTIGSDGSVIANFIVAANPKLVYTGAGQSFFVNAVSSALTIQRQDAQGNAITTSNLPVALSISGSTTGIFYSDAAGTNIITSTAIADGASSATVYYKDSTAGTPTITASASGYQPVATTFTIKSLNPSPTPTAAPSNGPTPTANPTNGPTPTANPSNGPTPTANPTNGPTPPPTENNKLVFVAGAPENLQTNTVSDIISVQRQDSIGTPLTTGTTSVTLSATAGTFYSDSACTTAVTTMTIGSGASTINFYYKCSTVGTQTLTATAANFDAATTTFTLTAQTPTTYTVTYAVNNDAYGTVNPSGTISNYIYGSQITITATAKSGYVFTGWTYSGNIVIADLSHKNNNESDNTGRRHNNRQLQSATNRQTSVQRQVQTNT